MGRFTLFATVTMIAFAVVRPLAVAQPAQLPGGPSSDQLLQMVDELTWVSAEANCKETARIRFYDIFNVLEKVADGDLPQQPALGTAGLGVADIKREIAACAAEGRSIRRIDHPLLLNWAANLDRYRADRMVDYDEVSAQTEQLVAAMQAGRQVSSSSVTNVLMTMESRYFARNAQFREAQILLLPTGIMQHSHSQMTIHRDRLWAMILDGLKPPADPLRIIPQAGLAELQGMKNALIATRRLRDDFVRDLTGGSVERRAQAAAFIDLVDRHADAMDRFATTVEPYFSQRDLESVIAAEAVINEMLLIEAELETAFPALIRLFGAQRL
jgi:hypothetical protein